MKLNPKKIIKLNDYLILSLTLGILILLNYLFTLLPLKIDLTAQKNHSLAKETKNLLKNLDDVVNIKVFLSQDDLPLRLKNSSDQLKDVLKEYETLSLGKLKIKYIDPGEDPQLLQEAQSLGIPKLQFSNIEGEQFQLSQGFFGLSLLYGDKSESIPLIDSTANLEYEITSRLARLIREKDIKIAFSTGHDEDNAQNGLQILGKALEQEYLIESVVVSTQSAKLINTDAKLLIITNPKKEFSNDESYLLDQYLMNDKSVLVLSGSAQVDASLKVTSFDSGLNDWLLKFGILIDKNLVLDSSNEIASFNSGLTNFFVPYPFWVKVLKDGFNDKHPLTANLETVLMPWTSSLTIDNENNLNPKVLFTSTNKAIEQKPPFIIDPTQEYDSKGKDFKKFNLAAIAEGELNSAFKNGSSNLFKDVKHKQSAQDAKLAVFASGQVFNDVFIDRFRSNALAFFNLVEYMASDLNLGNIRAKGDSLRPLKQIPDAQKSLIKYANIFGVSTVLIILGLIYFAKRNKKENK